MGPRTLLVLEDPLVGRRAHHDGTDPADEVVVVQRAGLVVALAQQPVKRVSFVGDETVEAGGGVVAGDAHAFAPNCPRSHRIGSPWSTSWPAALSIRRTNWRRWAE